MKLSTSSIVLFLTASTTASVLPARNDEWTVVHRAVIEPREENKDFYKSSSGGWAIELAVGREEVPYGNMHPRDVINLIDSHCEGGMCPNIPIEVGVKSWVANYPDDPNSHGRVEDTTLKVGFNAFYDDWMRTGIIQTLQWLVMDGVQRGRPEDKIVDVEGCEQNLNPDQINQDDCKEEKIIMWYGPKTLKMHMTELPGQGRTPGRDTEMQMTIVEKEVEGKDICGPLVGIAGAAAGAINPWLGAGVATLGLACVESPQV